MIPNLYDRLVLKEEHSESPINKKEAEFIYSFLKKKNIKKTLETGLGLGFSAAYIISATQSPHYVIDHFQKKYDNSGLQNIKKLKLTKYLRFERDFSHNALPKLLKKGVTINFAFIDGGHKFDHIFIDFYYIDLLLNQNGYVLFHDTYMPTTQMVISWIKNNKKNYIFIKSLKNLALFKKIGSDKRSWFHFKKFYTNPFSLWQYYYMMSIFLHTHSTKPLLNVFLKIARKFIKIIRSIKRTLDR